MPTYRFGPYVYDPATGSLAKGESQIFLRHQVNRLLHFLILNRERVLTREDILAEIWPGEYVEPNNFFQCINHLRKGLGDLADKPTYFRNFRRKGYQWICSIEEIPASPVSAKTPVASTQSWRMIGLSLAILVGCLWFLVQAVSNSEAIAGSTSSDQAKRKSVPPNSPSHPSLGAMAVVDSSGETRVLNDKTAANPGDRHAEKGHPMKAFVRARKAFRRGELNHCESWLIQALEQAKAAGDQQAEVMADLTLARIFRYRDPHEAKTKALRVKRLSHEWGDEVLFFEACYRLVLIHMDLGEIQHAIHLLEDTTFLASIKTPRQQALAKLAAGVVALRSHRLTQAQLILEELKTFRLSQMPKVVQPLVKLYEAALLLAQGHFDHASAKAKTAHEMLRRGDVQPLLEMRALWLSAQIETVRGNALESQRLHGRISEITDRFQFYFFARSMNQFIADWSLHAEVATGIAPAAPIPPQIESEDLVSNASWATRFNL